MQVESSVKLYTHCKTYSGILEVIVSKAGVRMSSYCIDNELN